MFHHLRKIIAGLSLLAVLGFAAQAMAANDAVGMDQAKMSLSQAISAAEEHVGGKASRAEFEHNKKNGVVYEVEVVNGTKVHDVKIDAQNGSVISSVEDTED